MNTALSDEEGETPLFVSEQELMMKRRAPVPEIDLASNVILSAFEENDRDFIFSNRLIGWLSIIDLEFALARALTIRENWDTLVVNYRRNRMKDFIWER